ncbi:S-layer homology domain-containing protein [Cohnella luojiensis]|nr:S-layer homology domain-containing protein [Cohnella luojiensis]
MSISPQRRRSVRNYRANAVGTLAAAVLFVFLTVPIAGAESAGMSSSATSAAEPMQNSSSGIIDPSRVKITEEQAAAKVRELFPVLKDAQMSDTRLIEGNESGQMGNNDPVWQISWTVQRGNHSSGFSSDVSAVTGDLLQMGIPSDIFSEPSFYPPKVSKQQALELARKFIGKAVPSLQSQTLQETKFKYGLTVTPLFGPIVYSLSFQASHDGVKIQGQSIQVNISGNGTVTNFYYAGSGLSFPPSKPKLTLTEAAKQWEQDLKLTLAYVPADYQWNRVPEKWSLAYVPEIPLNVLDAQTGQWTDGLNQKLDISKPYTYVALAATGEPYKSHPVTAEEAIKSISTIADIPETYKVQSKQLNKGRNGEHDTWHLRWGKDNNSFYDGRSAQVDAETGVLLSFYVDRWGPGANEEAAEKPALPKEKAVQIADAWILGHVPDGASYRRLDTSADAAIQDSSDVTLTYQLFYRDLMVQTRNISLTLNHEGRLVGMNSSLGMGSTEQLDLLKATLKPEEAKSKMLSSTQMDLVYVRSGGYSLSPSGKPIPVTMTLAYVPIDREYGEPFYRMVDAISGKMVSLYGNLQGAGTSAEPTDIQSHWARTALQTAIEHGVLVPDAEGKVHPNKKITTGDLIRMVALASSPYVENPNYNYYGAAAEKLYADVDEKSPYYRSVNYWIGTGWLKADGNEKLHPEAEITRDLLAGYLAKITGYEKLSVRLGTAASVSGLKDSKAIVNPGAVELALRLGLMNAKEGSFRPQGNVTVADAATILYRLARIQGELDRPLSR